MKCPLSSAILPRLYYLQPYPDIDCKEFMIIHSVQLKTMELAYRIEKVLHHDLPKLTHGNDGLIFTSATAPYQLGTDPKTFAHFFLSAMSLKTDTDWCFF
jgi:hypothetical protein